MSLAMASSEDTSWKECVKWLIRCNVLPSNHKANSPDSTIKELAFTLRDGVLLCNLLNILDKGCIDKKDVNQKPQMAQFLCLKNIKTFIKTCKEIFGLRDIDLFEASMLFELTDFYGVLHTLSKLSNCQKVQKNNIPGFSIHRSRSLSQDDIYKNLNACDEEEDRAELMMNSPEDDYGVYGYYSRISTDEKIYEDLCTIGQGRQSQIPSPVRLSLEQRDYIINELVETEKNYLDILETIHRCFMRPLSRHLNPEEVKLVFGSIKELIEIHTGFRNQLTKATSPGTSLRLSDVFINWREKFVIYGKYCSQLTSARDLIQEKCDNNETFNQEVIKCQQEANNDKYKLIDILTVPMQRILKYPLLLKRLIKETNPSHEDYRNLERAKEAMVDIAEYINEETRDYDKFQIMKQMKANISDWDIGDDQELLKFGMLIKDGELKIKAHDDQRDKLRYVFVFNKVMIMCKSKGGVQYMYRETLVLENFKIENMVNRKLLGRDGWRFQWYLVRKNGCTAYTLSVRTEEAKNKWYRAIEEAIRNNEHIQYKDHDFVMHTFQKPTLCNYCSKFLKGIVFQGYKCSQCNIPVHKLCYNNTSKCCRNLPIPDPLDRYPWFVHEMRRDRASTLLEKRIDGTYLLRIRPQGPTNENETTYALSLKTDNRVKHMKLYLEASTAKYYLSAQRYFRNIPELITYYERNTLAENYSELDECLKWPYHSSIVRAEYDFEPTHPQQLRLIRGTLVLVVSKKESDEGWWMGKIDDQIGLFPKNYVSEVTEN